MKRSTIDCGTGMTTVGRFRPIPGGDERRSQISSTRPLCKSQQRSPQHKQVDLHPDHVQPLRVLGEAEVTHFAEAEYRLQRQERMFGLGPHPQLASVRASLDRFEPAIAATAAVGHVAHPCKLRKDRRFENLSVTRSCASGTTSSRW